VSPSFLFFFFFFFFLVVRLFVFAFYCYIYHSLIPFSISASSLSLSFLLILDIELGQVMKNREGVESELISVRGEKASLSQKVTELQEQMRVICGERQKGTEKESQLSTEIKTLESTLAALQAQIERNGAENGILSHDFGKTPILFFFFSFFSFLCFFLVESTPS